MPLRWRKPNQESPHAHAARRTRLRPHLQRRLHGPEPVRRPVADDRRPAHPRRHRDDDPGRRLEHDRRRRPADGRDRRPAWRIAILPQDIPVDVVAKVVEYVKTCHPVFETPITLGPDATIGDALSLIHKRAHGAVVVVDDGRPVGVFTEKDGDGFDRFTQLRNVMSPSCDILAADVDPEEAFEQLGANVSRRAGRRRRRAAARRDHAQGRAALDDLPPGARRRRPADVGVAVGINGDPAGRAKDLVAIRRRRPRRSTPPTATRRGPSPRSKRSGADCPTSRSWPATSSRSRARAS